MLLKAQSMDDLMNAFQLPSLTLTFSRTEARISQAAPLVAAIMVEQ